MKDDNLVAYVVLQILPYFVMHVLGSLYGVPGLFMACLFSGTLRYCTYILLYLFACKCSAVSHSHWCQPFLV